MADQVDAREVEFLQHCEQVPRSDVVAHDLGAARALAEPRHVEGHQVERVTQLPPDQLERQQRERQRAEEHHRRPRRVTGLGHAHGPARDLSVARGDRGELLGPRQRGCGRLGTADTTPLGGGEQRREGRTASATTDPLIRLFRGDGGNSHGEWLRLFSDR